MGGELLAAGYRVLREGGRGATSTVWMAQQQSTGTLVAVKELRGDSVLQERFIREAGLGLKLSHPGIVRQLGAWIGADRMFTVMPWIEGASLRELLDREGAFETPEALWIVHEVATALAAAHGVKVIHRDVKPANVLIDISGAPLLCDFGIAKQTDEADVTVTGVSVGSPAYMAPEQIVAQAEAASDQYALGVVLFELLLGRRPFVGTASEVRMAHVNSVVPSLAGHFDRAGVPFSDALTQLLGRMVRKTPAERWPSLDAVAKAVAAIDGFDVREARSRLAARVARVRLRRLIDDQIIAFGSASSALPSMGEADPRGGLQVAAERDQLIEVRPSAGVAPGVAAAQVASVDDAMRAPQALGASAAAESPALDSRRPEAAGQPISQRRSSPLQRLGIPALGAALLVTWLLRREPSAPAPSTVAPASSGTSVPLPTPPDTSSVGDTSVFSTGNETPSPPTTRPEPRANAPATADRPPSSTPSGVSPPPSTPSSQVSAATNAEIANDTRPTETRDSVRSVAPTPPRPAPVAESSATAVADAGETVRRDVAETLSKAGNRLPISVDGSREPKYLRGLEQAEWPVPRQVRLESMAGGRAELSATYSLKSSNGRERLWRATFSVPTRSRSGRWLTLVSWVPADRP